ncbi:MAG: hypothetical protein AAGF92_24095 [Myxococcota bacterium]
MAAFGWVGDRHPYWFLVSFVEEINGYYDSETEEFHPYFFDEDGAEKAYLVLVGRN